MNLQANYLLIAAGYVIGVVANKITGDLTSSWKIVAFDCVLMISMMALAGFVANVLKKRRAA